ncbi:hypothetical protein Ctob_013588 [Chrysochromulina tobinii]|uniref:AP2/ERF domain-containing protein n=1 Tax=Chrysochromulina tobinii TaxID=1460289 RepID=A0A0M0JX87_9EUKA|nr:hypothetical protein Ctob_013588 [Chrysochromulina tobinii]|eukprot:KOO31165.1 hypothetical protein Ctob_013588 [Chrysochromulina sp. CCMP291]
MIERALQHHERTRIRMDDMAADCAADQSVRIQRVINARWRPTVQPLLPSDPSVRPPPTDDALRRAKLHAAVPLQPPREWATSMPWCPAERGALRSGVMRVAIDAIEASIVTRLASAPAEQPSRARGDGTSGDGTSGDGTSGDGTSGDGQGGSGQGPGDDGDGADHDAADNDATVNDGQGVLVVFGALTAEKREELEAMHARVHRQRATLACRVSTDDVVAWLIDEAAERRDAEKEQQERQRLALTALSGNDGAGAGNDGDVSGNDGAGDDDDGDDGGGSSGRDRPASGRKRRRPPNRDVAAMAAAAIAAASASGEMMPTHAGGYELKLQKRKQVGESSSSTGYEGVSYVDRRKKFEVKYRHIYIGTFGNAVEAKGSRPPALTKEQRKLYVDCGECDNCLDKPKFGGPKRRKMACSAPKLKGAVAGARDGRPQPLTPDEARAAAAAEGLELVPAFSNKTGFKGVSCKQFGKYDAMVRTKGTQIFLGTYATPEEAALHYARHIGKERAAAEAAEARDKGEPQTLTADEAKAAAAAEGLELVLSSSSETGFKGVRKNHGKYRAVIKENGKERLLGNFATPEEAALHYARHIGKERAAVEAAEARAQAPRIPRIKYLLIRR